MYAGGASARLLLVLLLALLPATAACSDSGDQEPSTATPATPAGASTVAAADLDGATYTSTSVTGHDLVEGTTIALTFQDGTLSASAGCNTQFAPYSLEGGVLTWAGAPASTMKGCSPELTEQDQWLAQLFADGMDATGDGSSLTLDGDDVTIELTSGSGADLSALLGRTWDVVGTVADGRTFRVPDRARPRLTVRQDGLARLDTGCNSGRTVVRVDGDALVFGPTTVTRQHCRLPDSEIQRRVLAVLDGRADTAVTDGSVLVVTKDGEGLVVQLN